MSIAFFPASTIAENGRKTCLKLKVFVRPSSKCLHEAQSFVMELVEVHSWIENQNSLCLLLWLPHFLLNYLLLTVQHTLLIYHKTALLAKKMFLSENMKKDDRRSHQMKSRSLHTSSECCHELCCLGCLISGLRGGLQMSLTYLAYTSNDLSFSLFSVIDSCVKTIGVHDRVFDVNDKVDNTLEPRG